MNEQMKELLKAKLQEWLDETEWDRATFVPNNVVEFMFQAASAVFHATAAYENQAMAEGWLEASPPPEK